MSTALKTRGALHGGRRRHDVRPIPAQPRDVSLTRPTTSSRLQRGRWRHNPSAVSSQGSDTSSSEGIASGWNRRRRWHYRSDHPGTRPSQSFPTSRSECIPGPCDRRRRRDYRRRPIRQRLETPAASAVGAAGASHRRRWRHNPSAVSSQGSDMSSSKGIAARWNRRRRWYYRSDHSGTRSTSQSSPTSCSHCIPGPRDRWRRRDYRRRPIRQRLETPAASAVSAVGAPHRGWWRHHALRPPAHQSTGAG